MLMLHVLNHILTANQDIKSHSNRIRSLEKGEEDFDSEQFRDQGYTRAKVLVPTRSTAHQFSKAMIDMMGEDCEIEEEERFEMEFGPPIIAADDDEEEKR